MISLGAKADEILSDAIRARAERVCFWDGKFTFVEPELAAIEAVLPAMTAGRYKFQMLVDGRWTDLGRYHKVLDVQRVFAALERRALGEAPGVSVSDLHVAWGINPDRFHTALRRVLYDTLDGHLKKPVAHGLDAMVEYFSGSQHLFLGDEYFEYFFSYLCSMRFAFEEGLLSLIYEPKLERVRNLASLVAERSSDWADSVGALAARDCVVGQILSLVDREAAADRYSRLRATPAAELISFFQWDSGALTYYRSRDLTPSSMVDAEAIVDSIEPLRVCPTANLTGVALSVDPVFYRIYAGWIYFYAQQLPAVDFNIFLCAEAGEADALIEDGDRFAQALGRLNLQGAPANVNIYRMPTPGYVKQRSTFYACARFFAANTLLDRYPNVYLMDADLYLEDDPSGFFAQLTNVAFAAPRTRTAIAVAPWRRYMAGNIAMNRSLLVGSVLKDLQSYMAHGLRHDGTWMLDQNALAFAIENDQGSSYRELNDFRRAFSTSKFMRTWERNFRRLATG